MALHFDKTDYKHRFFAFAGHSTITRFQSLYEVYKMLLKVYEYIVEIGAYKGIGSMLFAKLVKIFKPNTFTFVHRFDWFEDAKFKTFQFGWMPTPYIAKP